MGPAQLVWYTANQLKETRNLGQKENLKHKDAKFMGCCLSTFVPYYFPLE